MKYGPMKTVDSSMRKASEYAEEHARGVWEKPDAMYVLDQLRATISVANPMIVSIIVESLFDIPSFEIMSVKNKYIGTEAEVVTTGSPAILINVKAIHSVLPPMVFEIQIYIDAFLMLKRTQHMTYEFKRA